MDRGAPTVRGITELDITEHARNVTSYTITLVVSALPLYGDEDRICRVRVGGHGEERVA